MKKLLISMAMCIFLMLSVSIIASANSVSFETEDFTLHGGFAVREDATASGGKYMVALLNNWNAIEKPEQLGDTQLEYTFEVENDGNYIIHLRIAAPAYNTGDSFYYAVDDVLYACHYSMNEPIFTWYKGGIFKLQAGKHTFRIWCRESGSMLDKVIVTDNPIFSPVDMGELPERDMIYYEGGEGDVISPLPAQVPPSEHPRVLVKKSDLPKIKANLTHPQNKAAYERVLEKAQSTLNGDQSGYSPDLLEIMQSKAFLYMINGDEQMGQQAVEMVMNHIRKVDFGTKMAETNSMRSSGHVLFATSCVYDWCYDLFTPEQRAEYITLCEDMVTLNFEGGYPIVEKIGRFTGSYHRDENPIFKDLLAFGIAVYDEKPFVYNNVVGVLYANYLNWREWYYPSHWMINGVNTYGNFRMTFEVFGGYLLHVIGQDPLSHDDQRNTMYKSVYWRRPDGAVFVDADETTRSYKNTYLKYNNASYFILGNLCDDPIMKWQYYKNKASTNYFGQGYLEVTAPMYLLINNVDVPLENKAELPLTKYYPSPINVMMARTSWEEGADSPAVLVAMKPFETYMSGHAHRETGNFQIYYKGALAMETGQYQAPGYTKADGTKVQTAEWGTAHHAAYSSAPIAHNCLIVYDPAYPNEITYGGQWPQAASGTTFSNLPDALKGSNKTAEPIGYDYGPDKNKPEYSYIESDLTPGYRSDRVKKYSRSFMFLNLFDDEIPGALIVYDRMESTNKEYQKSWLLHSQEEPRVDGNIVTIDRTELHNNGRLTNTILMPEAFKVDKIGGPGYEYWDGVTNREISRSSSGDESGTWRVEIKPENKSTNDYFLNVLQVSDADDSIIHHKVTSSVQGEFIGVFIADRAVFMKKDVGSVYKNFSVSAEGEGDVTYIITNLIEGKWTVTDENGNVVDSQLIAEEHGVLRFRAKAGAYNVSWQYEDGIKPKSFDIVGDAEILDYSPVSIFVNDKHYNGQARIDDGILMVSLDDMTELTSRASFTIDGETFTAKGSYGEIKGTVGVADADINGQNVKLSLPPMMHNGKIYIPIDAAKEVYEFVSEYDELTYILYLSGGYYMVPGADVAIINVEDRNRADVLKTTCSSIFSESNTAVMSLDNVNGTYWCSTGKDQWIQYELAEAYELTGVGLAWLNGTARQQYFAVHVSEDGITWKELFRGASSGTTASIEDTMFAEPIKAKYVKIECNENSANQMNSLSEIHIYCTNKTPYYEK